MQRYFTDKLKIVQENGRIIVLDENGKVVKLIKEHYNDLVFALENLQDVTNEIVDSLNQKENFEKQVEIGSLVKIENIGGTYSTYTEWLIRNLKPSQYGMFILGELPKKEDVYQVVYIGKHEYERTQLAYIKSMHTGQCYIIKSDCLKVLM